MGVTISEQPPICIVPRMPSFQALLSGQYLGSPENLAGIGFCAYREQCGRIYRCTHPDAGGEAVTTCPEGHTPVTS